MAEDLKRSAPDVPEADSEPKRAALAAVIDEVAEDPNFMCVWRLKSRDMEDVIDYGVLPFNVVEKLQAAKLFCEEGPEVTSHTRPSYRSRDIEIVVNDTDEVGFLALKDNVLTDGPGVFAMKAFQFHLFGKVDSDSRDEEEYKGHVKPDTTIDY